MTCKITLTAAGADTGPFNLYSNLDGYVTAFATGVAKSSLVAGYTSSVVPDYATTVRIKSTGNCTTFTDTTVMQGFVPYSYTSQVRCVSSGPTGQYVFEVTIDTYGAPTWNQIIVSGSTIGVNQGGGSTAGAKFPVHLGGTKYQCSSVVGFNYNSNATLTTCNIRVSDGSTDHIHTFAVPLTFVPAEMISATYKNINVNVT